MPDGLRDSKPSYGMIGFRRQHGNRHLFGSDIGHNSYITLTVKESAVERSLNQDWYYGGKTILELVLSQMQFAELLTTLNVGDGVPCTLTFRESVGRIEPETSFENKREIFDREIQEICNKTAEKLNNLEVTIKAIKMSQKDRGELLSQINIAKGNVSANIPFVLEQFTEAMNQIVADSKAEVDGFVTQTIHKAGLETLQNKSTAKNNILISSED